MSRLARLLLFTLVALWLPVTLHCKLEAAGVLDQHDSCCTTEQPTASSSDCKDDSCPTVEDTLFKESARALQLTAPAATDCFAWLALAGLERDLRSTPTLLPPRHGPPPELKVTWQFVTRAAPPARAPSLDV